MAEKPVVYDVDGHEIITNALDGLLNRFPGLGDEQIYFSTLEQDRGFGFFPVTGAVIFSEQESIDGDVIQVCQYPFTVVRRVAPTAEKQRIRIKEQLDSLGKWLEKQPVVVQDETHVLEDYPALTQGREIKAIARTTPAFLESAGEDGVEDWTISILLQYTSEFNRYF